MNIKLVKNYNQIRPDRATLFCFPFAGGGASAYNSWVQKIWLMSDILKGPLHSFASFCAGKIQVVKRFPKILALAIFGNGMNKKQREKLYSSLCGESTNLLFERINECKLETSIKWILPTKDRALNPKQQRVYMNNIGNIKSIIKLTAPHDVMISHPEEVAKILLEN